MLIIFWLVAFLSRSRCWHFGFYVNNESVWYYLQIHKIPCILCAHLQKGRQAADFAISADRLGPPIKRHWFFLKQKSITICSNFLRDLSEMLRVLRHGRPGSRCIAKARARAFSLGLRTDDWDRFWVTRRWKRTLTSRHDPPLRYRVPCKML